MGGGGLRGQVLGCEWLAGFVYKITTGSSNNGGGRVVGLLCTEQNVEGSNLAVILIFDGHDLDSIHIPGPLATTISLQKFSEPKRSRLPQLLHEHPGFMR